MLILDTNVISEVLRQTPDEHVASWFKAQPTQQSYITAVTQAGILYGIASMPKERRRQKLQAAAQLIFDEDFATKILSFEAAATPHFAEIGAVRKSSASPSVNSMQ